MDASAVEFTVYTVCFLFVKKNYSIIAYFLMVINLNNQISYTRGLCLSSFSIHSVASELEARVILENPF